MLNGVFIGDLHLDVGRLHQMFGERTLELQLNEVRKALDYAIDRGLEYAIFGGDIGDNPRLSLEAQIGLTDLLQEYDGRLEIHIILGNHDWRQLGFHSLQYLHRFQSKLFKTVTFHHKPAKLKLGGVDVNFLPYPATKRLKGGPAVNIGHFETVGAVHDSGRKIKDGVDLKAGQDVWLIGHLHTPQLFKKRRIYFSGTMYQLNFGEGQKKGWLEFSYKMNNGVLVDRTRFVENDPQFKLFNLEISTKVDLKQISRNELHRYRLFVSENLVLPDSLWQKYVDAPNIDKIVGYRTKEELAVLQSDTAFVLDDDQEDVQLDYGLADFLKAKGVSGSQIKAASALLKTILGAK